MRHTAAGIGRRGPTSNLPDLPEAQPLPPAWRGRVLMARVKAGPRVRDATGEQFLQPVRRLSSRVRRLAWNRDRQVGHAIESAGTRTTRAVAGRDVGLRIRRGGQRRGAAFYWRRKLRQHRRGGRVPGATAAPWHPDSPAEQQGEQGFERGHKGESKVKWPVVTRLSSRCSQVRRPGLTRVRPSRPSAVLLEAADNAGRCRIEHGIGNEHAPGGPKCLTMNQLLIDDPPPSG